MRATKLLFAVGLTAVLGLSGPAEATSLSALSVEQMTDASELIVRATVTEVWTERDDRGRIWTRAQLEVGQVLKGDASTDSVIIDQMGGVLGEDYMIVASAPRFSVGEEGVFFLEHLGSGLTSVVGWFQGKYTVRIDPDSGREMLVRFVVSQDRVYDHRFIPHPAPDERLYVDSLVGQVEARVQAGWDGRSIPGVSDDKLESINARQQGVK